MRRRRPGWGLYAALAAALFVALELTGEPRGPREESAAHAAPAATSNDATRPAAPPPPTVGTARCPSCPAPTEQLDNLSPLRQQWLSHIADELRPYGNITRRHVLRAATLGWPWTMVVHVIDSKQLWLAPPPVPLNLTGGRADVFVKYAAGTLGTLQLMLKNVDAVSNATLAFHFSDNCLADWRQAAALRSWDSGHAANASVAWQDWVGGSHERPVGPYSIMPPLKYQNSGWRPSSLDCHALPFPSYDWVWPSDITEGSPNRVDGLQRVAWEARRPLVFFRGSYRPDSISLHQLGARTRAARVGLQHPAILDVKLYMHCKAGTPACSDPPPGDLEDALFGQYLSLDQQLAYKYQLDIDGYAGSFRLKHLMLSGSLVFKVDSPFTQHWMLALVPWVHFVPVSWHNLEQDLPRKVQWARANDARAKQIMLNGRAFAMDAFKDDNTAWYMQQMVSGISRRQPPLESLVPGTARFCCSLLDGDPRLKHFHKKCVMYEPAGAGCASAARTLDDFYRF